MIETQRLFLRPVVETDFPDIYRLMSDPEVMKHIRPASDDPEPVRTRMGDWERYSLANPGLGVFLAEWKEDGAFAGYVVARHVDFDPATGEYEVGYTLAPEHWGKGLATEITRALSAYLFEHFRPGYVVAFTAVENLASQNVLLKAGFTDVGMRDVYGGSQEFRLYSR
jgi:ribosomal-protein-alanine N-acetyltransferase